MKGKFLYDVYDYDKNIKVLENADSDTVNKLTGLRPYAVSTYANNGNLYHGKYGFECVNREEFEKTLDLQDRATMQRFDNAMEALKINYPPERLKLIVFTCKEDKVTQ